MAQIGKTEDRGADPPIARLKDEPPTADRL
jgi:hypothetical protein